MITITKANEVLNTLSASLDNSISEYLKNHECNFSELSYEDAHNKVSVILADTRSLIGGETTEGFIFPKYQATFKSYEKDGKLEYIELTVSSAIKARTKVSGSREIYVSDTFTSDIMNAIAADVKYLLKLELANDNLDDFNSLLNTLTADTGISVNFAISENYISEITDSKIVYGVPVESALAVTTMGMTYVPNGVDVIDVAETTAENTASEETAPSEEGTPEEGTEAEAQPAVSSGDDFIKFTISENQEKFVTAITGRTTPQIVKSKIALIEKMTGVTTIRRVDNLIRLSYHKKAENVKNMKKDGVGYFKTTTTVDGEEVEIFALVEKKGEDLSVCLSPFNIKTGFAVEYDVLKNI